MVEKTPTKETTRITSPRCPECSSPIFSTTGWCAECGAELPGGKSIPANRLPEHVNPINPVSYANFFRRFSAFVIDCVFVTFAILLTYAVVGKVTVVIAGDLSFIGQALATTAEILIAVTITWLYFTVMEASEEMATLGKKIVGLKVIGPDGKAISFGKANVRFWWKCVSAALLGYGFLMINSNGKHQGLHDLRADTTVIMDHHQSAPIFKNHRD
jgi:uncharacterized RDD family membrane protein YckC